MKHTVLMLLAAALVVSLQATPSQAITLKMPGTCVSPQCCEEPQCCTEPECCEEPQCCKPICPRCHKSSCMIVCKMKKIKKTVWVVECEKFAPVNPGCNLLDLLHGKLKPCTKRGCCEPEACGETCGDDCCGKSCCKKSVPPQCGKVRCKKKLIKKEITCEVPVYKCVVTGCCTDGCSDGCGDSAPVETPTAQPKAAPAPAPTPKAKEAAPTPEKEADPVARLRVPVFTRY